MVTKESLAQAASARRFYSIEGAHKVYKAFMRHFWLHGDPEAEAAGMTHEEAAKFLVRRLVKRTGLGPDDWLLDFGSGPGGATAYMSQVAGGARCVGVSNSDPLSQMAYDYVRGLGTVDGVRLSDRVEFLTVADNAYRHLPWPDDSFTVTSFYESVCHLLGREEKQRAIDELYRLTKPGGWLIGTDWIRRPFGEYQTPEQIDEVIDPICEYIRLGGLETIEGYADMLETAGFEVVVAEDMFAGRHCWGSTPPEGRQRWLTYSALNGGARLMSRLGLRKDPGMLFRLGKEALDTGRREGPFSVGEVCAVKPARV